MDQDNQVHAHNQDEKEAQVKAVDAEVKTEAADGTLSENDLDQVAGGGFGSIMKLSNIRSDW